MDIPAVIRLGVSLQRGAVYRFIDPALHTAPHYYVVLNVDPKADTVLVLCIATSQVGKAQSRVALRRQNPGTIVVIQVEDTTVFPRKSAFDCNSVYSVSPEELAQKINASRISSMDMVLEEDLVNRIVAGVHLSDVVAGELKELL